MARIENDLSRLSDGEIRKRIDQATKVHNEIEKADSHEVVRSGKADEYLSRLESAGNDLHCGEGRTRPPVQSEAQFPPGGDLVTLGSERSWMRGPSTPPPSMSDPEGPQSQIPTSP